MVINDRLYKATRSYVDMHKEDPNAVDFSMTSGVLSCHAQILNNSSCLEFCGCMNEDSSSHFLSCPISTACWPYSGHYPEIVKAWYVKG